MAKNKKVQKPRKVSTQVVGYRRWRLTLWLALAAVASLGMTYAAVPLYKMFCQLVGIPVPGVAVQSNSTTVALPDGREIVVRFMASSDVNMPVEIEPVVPSVRAKVGEPTLVAYQAVNPTNRDINGIAIHTVTMHGKVNSLDALQYIDLLKCFCFDSFTYPAGQEVPLPVSFTIRPDLPQGVNTLLFNYTLFETEQAPAEAVAAGQAKKKP